jgi:hypothetical protein
MGTSLLSPGVSHARYFDQAARNVGCMAEVLMQRGKMVETYSRLGFYVLAPSKQLKKERSFRKYTSVESIKKKVADRVEEYEKIGEGERKRAWFNDGFLPLIDRIEIKCLSWEEIISFISQRDTPFGHEINAFYENCLQFNRPTAKDKIAS